MHFGERLVRRCKGALSVGAAVTALLLASGCIQPTERPLLWMVEGDTPAFLYGTIHLPDARVLAVPPVVRAAFELSDVVYTEIPLDHDAEKKVESITRLPEGQTLRDVLPSGLYERTARHFRVHGIDLAALANRKVWFIAMSAGVLDCMGDFLWRPPLDKYFWTLARWKGKQTAAIETMDEQVAIFESLTPEEQVAQLESTLAACERAAAEGTSPCRQLIEIYLRGEESEQTQALEAGSGNADDSTNRRLMSQLVAERNVRMAERIVARLRDEPERVHFFCLGAGHMVGDDGVVARLVRDGFQVRRLTPTDLSGLQGMRARVQ